MVFIERVKKWSTKLKSEAITVWYISKHPNTPWHTRALAIGLVAYAFSPIDLIPDFIPVLGYADDLIILPLGVLMIFRMTPDDVIVECRARAQDHAATRTGKPSSRLGPVLAIAGWVIAAVLIAILARQAFPHASVNRVGQPQTGCILVMALHVRPCCDDSMLTRPGGNRNILVIGDEIVDHRG